MESVVSDFIIKTCRLHPKPNFRKSNALCFQYSSVFLTPRDARSHATISSGIASEFYIEPMLPCIGDIDIMYHNSWLAIPAGHSVPRLLPTEFHREVTVYELLDTQFPCYVLPRKMCTLFKRSNSEYYTCVMETEESYVTADKSMPRHGPAVIQANSTGGLSGSWENLSVDIVACIRCLVWPPQAAVWPKRRRTNGWPGKTTIDCVVSNGCDVVQVAHPQCRQDDSDWTWGQWRLSFSRAETVLLNSWSPKQQIIYHMLRIFMKTTDRHEIKHLHNYFTKTLLMWACELYSQSTWDSLCVVSICTRLLNMIAMWLKSGKYPTYFVEECNLLDSINDVRLIEYWSDYFDSISDDTLSVWFIEHYIRQCAELSKTVYDVRSLSALQNTLSTIVNWRQNNETELSCLYFEHASGHIEKLWPGKLLNFQKSAETYKLFVAQIQTIDPRMLDFTCGLFLLNVGLALQKLHFDSGLGKTLLTIIEIATDIGSHNIDKYKAFDSKGIYTDCRQTSCYNDFNVAIVLMRTMQLTRNNLASLLIEVLKAYLHMLLNCAQPRCIAFHACVNCTLHVYLACLYYSTDQYRISIDHCLKAITPMHSVQCIETKLLPQFNIDNTDVVFGLILFYQMVVDHQHKNRSTDNCTANLLAYYLLLLCLSNEHDDAKCKVQNKFMKDYKTRLRSSKTLFIADVLLYFIIRRKIQQCDKVQLMYSFADRCDSITTRTRQTEFNADRLCQLLTRSAVEHLTAFRQAMCRDYSSVRTIVTTDFQAMYAYKCGWYQQCFQLCSENLESLRYASSITSAFSIPSDLLLLMDDDSVSLFGLATLCLCSKKNWMAMHGTEHVTQLTLTMYLLVKSRLQTSHGRVTCINAILSNIRLVHNVYNVGMILNRSMMLFLYRKVQKRSSAGHR